MTDLLDELDAMARTSVLPTPVDIRSAWLEAIQEMNDATGSFDAARIRPTMPEEFAHGSEIGNLFRHLSQSGAARVIDVIESGNTEHRAAHSLIRKWTLTRRVFPEVGA